jgi:hypothetical protein
VSSDVVHWAAEPENNMKEVGTVWSRRTHNLLKVVKNELGKRVRRRHLVTYGCS